MGTNWTPGPWRVEQGAGADDDKLFVTSEQRIEGGFIPIAEIDFDYSDPIGAEQRANACLISATPDLYAAVREAQCPRPCNGRPDDLTAGACFDLEECGCTFGAALSKAEGAA